MAAVAVIFLTACGSSDDGNSVPGPGGSEPPPSGLSACQNSYSPERLDAGEECSPVKGFFCPSIAEGEAGNSRTELVPCDGVVISEHNASGGGLTSPYYAIRRSGGQPDAIYLALHYLNASTEFFSNLIRLTELAKGRDLLVIVPQAPQASGLLDMLPGSEALPVQFPTVGDNVLSRWPTNFALEPVGMFVELLDAVVADARSELGAQGLPLYVAGLSNGGTMAYNYGCARAEAVEAILAVATSQGVESVAACAPRAGLGTVIVHGTLDFVTPYQGVPRATASIPAIHENFKRLNGCGGEDLRAVGDGEPDQSGVSDRGTVQIDYTRPCRDGKRNVLVTLIGNGHNWPGEDNNALLSQLPNNNLGLLGPIVDDFDATLHGFDLMRRAAGN